MALLKYKREAVSLTRILDRLEEVFPNQDVNVELVDLAMRIEVNGMTYCLAEGESLEIRDDGVIHVVKD